MEINFSKQGGLVPAIVQDAQTLKVLMLGYMNEEALRKTLETHRVTFFSRSRNQLWTKGETSGHFLELVEIKLDCDDDTILIKANPIGPTCHTGADTCFFEKNTGKSPFLHYLEEIIAKRHQEMPEGSYTTSLFQKGINKIAQKVGEEAVELIIEAKDNNKQFFLGEAADLLFHFLVLLEAKQVKLDEVIDVLQKRHASTAKKS
ncbi:MAG: bifunctional phosphoribosyl-AMP cyclohydrolase/phosphoribosyl-ATP diphosphatase HisIE [Cytophagales bacterium]|nr:bifunctional phosphoribosyl-AMP cyclohydrolase/phosphoribosyl-ATP diphosphatase HisIE [Cytophagales bacterium]MDW8384593.1 bifunctional phosphoribosyl-AMP cyclohydrolase/phosphoribosyl-ATP diphosphatase HisIE [Flammeovirgaceae bacterium]